MNLKPNKHKIISFNTTTMASSGFFGPSKIWVPPLYPPPPPPNDVVNNIIYKAVSTSTNPPYKEKIYLGTAETTFKLRYSNHQRLFKFLNYKTDTELSNEVWQRKKSGQTSVITWKIVRRCSPYNPDSKRCYLCSNEKMEIATYRGYNLLNKKTELISKCRHQNKYTLSKYDTKDWRQLYCKKPLYCNFRFVNHIWLKTVG